MSVVHEMCALLSLISNIATFASRVLWGHPWDLDVFVWDQKFAYSLDRKKALYGICWPIIIDNIYQFHCSFWERPASSVLPRSEEVQDPFLCEFHKDAPVFSPKTYGQVKWKTVSVCVCFISCVSLAWWNRPHLPGIWVSRKHYLQKKTFFPQQPHQTYNKHRIVWCDMLFKCSGNRNCSPFVAPVWCFFSMQWSYGIKSINAAGACISPFQSYVYSDDPEEINKASD